MQIGEISSCQNRGIWFTWNNSFNNILPALKVFAILKITYLNCYAKEDAKGKIPNKLRAALVLSINSLQYANIASSNLC